VSDCEKESSHTFFKKLVVFIATYLKGHKNISKQVAKKEGLATGVTNTCYHTMQSERFCSKTNEAWIFYY
jgi:hypothetical protein